MCNVYTIIDYNYTIILLILKVKSIINVYLIPPTPFGGVKAKIARLIDIDIRHNFQHFYNPSIEQL